MPMRHAHLSEWTRGSYFADGDFYSALSELVPRIYLIKKVRSQSVQLQQCQAAQCTNCPFDCSKLLCSELSAVLNITLWLMQVLFVYSG